MSADYEFLTPETVADYVRARPALAARLDADNLTAVKEVGDGNLNLVFIAHDGSGRGLVLKQALPYVRLVGAAWPMTPERAKFEANSLMQHHELVPELVVEVLHFDPERHIIVMEDLSDHQVWRGALNNEERHDGAAAEVGRYIGAVAFGTSLFALERADLSAQQAYTVNPELCEITEDLVFTEPWVNAGRNEYLAANETDAAELAGDQEMVAAMGLAKYKFMTAAEALIHGDLHTGSVMVRSATATAPQSVKVFDSEFAFYGPVAFDIGAVWANLVIAAARAYALGQDERATWCLAQVEATWEGFAAEFRRRWPTRRDPRMWDEKFCTDLLARWQEESWLFAAAKMSRRMVGMARTRDIESLKPAWREGAVRGVLRTARAMIRQRLVEANPARIGEIASEIMPVTRTF